MGKKILVSFIVALGLATIVNANDTLKSNMDGMAGSLSAAQMGFFSDSEEAIIASVKDLKAYVNKVVGDEKAIIKLLPENMKYKSAIAIQSANIIKKNIAIMEKNLTDKSVRTIDKHMRTQKAFVEIEKQCFKCHNLVRDWENLK